MAGKCEAEAQQGCTERLVSVRDAIHRSGPEREKAIDHYTVYGGTLLIRNDADGRSYLYDLLDVQKEGNQRRLLLRCKAFGGIRAKTF